MPAMPILRSWPGRRQGRGEKKTRSRRWRAGGAACAALSGISVQKMGTNIPHGIRRSCSGCPGRSCRGRPRARRPGCRPRTRRAAHGALLQPTGSRRGGPARNRSGFAQSRMDRGTTPRGCPPCREHPSATLRLGTCPLRWSVRARSPRCSLATAPPPGPSPDPTDTSGSRRHQWRQAATRISSEAAPHVPSARSTSGRKPGRQTS